MIVRPGKASLKSFRAVRKGRLETFVGGSYCPQVEFLLFHRSLGYFVEGFQLIE